MNKEIILFLLFIAIISVFVLNFVYMHEYAHRVINNNFGVKSHTEFNLNGGITYIDSNFNSVEEKNTAFMAHSINESIGYQLLPSIIIICFSIFLSAIYLKGDKK